MFYRKCIYDVLGCLDKICFYRLCMKFSRYKSHFVQRHSCFRSSCGTSLLFTFRTMVLMLSKFLRNFPSALQSRTSFAFEVLLELLFVCISCKCTDANGDGEIRTHDPLLARQVLSQLSYTPICMFFFFNPAATCFPIPSPV